MTRKDNVSFQKFLIALQPQSVTSAVNGKIIDRLGCSALAISIASGSISAGTFAFKLQHSQSSDMSGAVDVPAEELIGSLVDFADTDDNLVQTIGYLGLKRYVRLICTPAGNSGSNYFSATAVKGGLDFAGV